MTDVSQATNNKNKFSLIKYIFGFSFFISSFALIYWHEENINNNISVYAERSTNAELVSSDKSDDTDASSITDLTDNNAIPLNFLSGKLSSSTPIGLDVLLDGQYVAIKRITEMYSWKIGDTPSSYTYEWTETPNTNITDVDHINPQKSLINKTLISHSLNIKGIRISQRSLKLDNKKMWTTIKTDSDKYMTGTADNFPNDGTYFYQNDKDNPSVGDIRIKYQIIPTSKTITIFGAMDNDTLIKHTSEFGRQLFTFFEGDKKAAVKSLSSDNFIYIFWGIRLLSVVIMVLGIKMMIPSIASSIKSYSLFEGQEIVSPKLSAFLTTILIAVAAITSATLRHSITDLVGLGILLIILILTIFIILNKIAYNKAHEDMPKFEIIEDHKAETTEGKGEGEGKTKAKPKTKREPPKAIDMVSVEELDIDDMSITLSSGEVIDEHGHGILPVDMPQAGIGQPVSSQQPVLEESSEPIELTLGEAIKPTPKKSATLPPPLPSDSNEDNNKEPATKPKSLFDSDET